MINDKLKKEFDSVIEELLKEGLTEDEIISIFTEDSNEEPKPVVKEPEIEKTSDDEEPKKDDTSRYMMNLDSRMRDGQVLMTEEYILGIAEDLATVFNEDEIVDILAGDYDDYTMRLHKWTKMGQLRERRLSNVKNAIQEGFLDGYAEWLDEQAQAAGSMPDPRLKKNGSSSIGIPRNKSLVPQVAKATSLSTAVSATGKQQATRPKLPSVGLGGALKAQGKEALGLIGNAARTKIANVKNDVRRLIQRGTNAWPIQRSSGLQKQLGGQSYKHSVNAQTNMNLAKHVTGELDKHEKPVSTTPPNDHTTRIGQTALDIIKAGGNHEAIGKAITQAHGDYKTKGEIQKGVHAGVSSALSGIQRTATDRFQSSSKAAERYGKLAKDKNVSLPWRNAFTVKKSGGSSRSSPPMNDREKNKKAFAGLLKQDYQEFLDNGFTERETLSILQLTNEEITKK